MTSMINNNGVLQEYDSQKLLRMVQKHCIGLNLKYINPTRIVDQVSNTLPPECTLKELIEQTAEVATVLKLDHHHYGLLAGRILMHYLHKITSSRYVDVCIQMIEFVHPILKTPAPLLKRSVFDFIVEHEAVIQAALGDFQQDFTFDYFAVKTLQESYLITCNGKIVERPQHFFMRVACALNCGDGGWKPDIQGALESYRLFQQKFYTHATPTLSQAGLNKANLSSCYLLSFTDQSDSIMGIYDKLKECAIISAKGGGIGIGISDIRASGSYICGSNGTSNGIVPMLRNFNTTARYVDQGGNKRKGAFAIYMEPWHRDIVDFLSLKRPGGKEDERAHDLFYGLWIPDLFMERVEQDADWCLFCPKDNPGLTTSFGEAFNKLYTSYELNVPASCKSRIKARSLWKLILEAQIESGTPYMLYKDACNRKSNQQHLGTIKCSNLCVEVIQYSDDNETACCNLASVALWRYVKEDKTFDYPALHAAVKRAIINLNKVIDITSYYETDKFHTSPARRSNLRHRPMGIGCQGLATMFLRMLIAFDSEEALIINDHIFETMYHAALEQSVELAIEYGAHESFPGSKFSQGQFQFDLWGVLPGSEASPDLKWRGTYDWKALRAKVMKYGTRNSLLLAPMPTASTAQILGSSEGFEPQSSNVYVRNTKCGSFACTTDELIDELDVRGLWNNTMKQKLIIHDGSIQNIEEIPADLRAIFKTSWDIKQRVIIKMAADRGKYIDQSMSMSLHMAAPTTEIDGPLTSMHFTAWKAGLKTGMYYLRSKPPNFARKYAIDPELMFQEMKKKKTTTTTEVDSITVLNERDNIVIEMQQLKQSKTQSTSNEQSLCYLPGGNCCGS
jgi:ribonucleoside-diphosphate reductase subunit M1